ncbi:MAG: hypothetical protein K2H18_07135 [Muribaculaceae bacterium]|nr:hypothetical protein [Muribaculaceae bacterium]
MKKKILSICLCLSVLPFMYSCGGSDTGSSSSESQSEYAEEEADFSEIAGEWELNMQGAGPLDSSTLIVRISRSGDVSVKQWADTGYSQHILLQGEGYVEGRGIRIMITLPDGPDAVAQLPLTYRNGYLITTEGQSLHKKLY